MDELILRINSIVKRLKKHSIINIGDVEFDFDVKEVRVLSTVVKFSLKALELFELFYQNNNSIVTKDMIIDKLWNRDENYSDRSIRVYVNNIKKLFTDESIFKITSIKNIGYKINY